MFIKIGNTLYNSKYIVKIYVKENRICFLFNDGLNEKREWILYVEYSTPKKAEENFNSFVNHLSFCEKTNIYTFVEE